MDISNIHDSRTKLCMFVQSNVTLAHMEEVGHRIEKVRNCLGNKNGESSLLTLAMHYQSPFLCHYDETLRKTTLTRPLLFIMQVLQPKIIERHVIFHITYFSVMDVYCRVS